MWCFVITSYPSSVVCKCFTFQFPLSFLFYFYFFYSLKYLDTGQFFSYFNTMRIIITYKVVILLRVEINYINKRHIGSSLWKVKGSPKKNYLFVYQVSDTSSCVPLVLLMFHKPVYIGKIYVQRICWSFLYFIIHLWIKNYCGITQFFFFF